MDNIITKLKPIHQIFLDNNSDIRFVGECVRDTIFNTTIKDVNLVTPMHYKTAYDLLKSHNYECIFINDRYKGFFLKLDKKIYEISSLFYKINNNIEFTNNWKLNIKKIDFTMNSLYLDFDKIIYDYTNGFNDLNNNIIKFNNDTKINNNIYWVIRYYKFTSIYGKNNVDEKLTKIFNEIDYSSLPIQIINHEFRKIFETNNYFEILNTMINNNIMNKLLKEFSISRLQKYIKCENKYNIKNNPHVRCVVFSKDFALKPSDQKIMKLINQDLFKSTKYHLSLHNKKYLTYYVYLKYVFENRDDELLDKILDIIQNTHIPIFPINIHDLRNLKYCEKDYEWMLDAMRRYWSENNYMPNKEECLAHIKHII